MARGRVSSEIIGLINLLSIFPSLVILVTGILLSKSATTECERLIDTPLIVIGTLLLIITLTGIIGGCCNKPALLWLYIVFMSLLIIGAVGFSIFGFVVTNKSAGQFVSGKGIKDYRVGNYSNWLQNRVNNTRNWDKIKSCLVGSQICTHFHRMFPKNTTFKSFQEQPLSPLQSGCCKPPSECIFTFRSPTNWTEEEGVYDNPDCKTWGNDHSVLCFNCQSCKARVYYDLRDSWKTVTIYSGLSVFLLFIVYIVACCAFLKRK